MASQARAPASLAGHRQFPVRARLSSGSIAWRPSVRPPRPMGTVSRSYQKAHAIKVRSAANELPEGGSPDLGEQTPEQSKASRWALPRPPSLAPLSRRFEERHAWYRITMIAARKLGQNLVPILMVQAMGDAALFVLHRLCHRLTNEGVLCWE